MCSRERTASLIYVGSVIVFPKQTISQVKWGLNITDSKLKAKQQIFLARPSGTPHSQKKKTQVLTPIELIMTTQLPLRLNAIFFVFTACLALDYSDYGFKCCLTMHWCWIKERFRTCRYLSPMLEFQKDDNYRTALLWYYLLTSHSFYVSDNIEFDIR